MNVSDLQEFIPQEDLEMACYMRRISFEMDGWRTSPFVIAGVEPRVGVREEISNVTCAKTMVFTDHHLFEKDSPSLYFSIAITRTEVSAFAWIADAMHEDVMPATRIRIEDMPSSTIKVAGLSMPSEMYLSRLLSSFVSEWCRPSSEVCA